MKKAPQLGSRTWLNRLVRSVIIMNTFLPQVNTACCYAIWLFVASARLADHNVCIHTVSLTQQASQCLKEQSHRISAENTRLRAELQQLIEATADLQAQKCRLEKQHLALQQDHQFNMELQQQRGIRWSMSFEMGPELNLLQLQQQQQQRKPSAASHSKLLRR